MTIIQQMRPIILLGTSNYLEVILRICKLNNFTVAGIVDSDFYGNLDQQNNIPIIGSELSFDFKSARQDHDFFIAQSMYTSDPRSREKRHKYIKLIEANDLSCASLIHPRAEIFDTAEISPGCMISFFAGISGHVRIGAHSQIHSYSMIGHDATIGQNVCFHPDTMCASAAVIDDDVVVMPGSAIIKTGKENRHIGKGAIIHPRVTVARDVDTYEIISLAGNNTRRIYGAVVRT